MTIVCAFFLTGGVGFYSKQKMKLGLNWRCQYYGKLQYNCYVDNSLIL